MGILDAPAYSQAVAEAKFARPKNTIVIHGDSNTRACGPNVPAGSVQSIVYGIDGYWTHAARVMRQPLKLLANTGVSGETSAQILARFDSQVASLRPGYVLIMAGTNDGTLAASGTIANLAAMYDKAAAIGAYVIAGTLLPLNSPATGQRANMAIVNRWIKQQALTRQNFVAVDWTSALQDVNGNFITPTLSSDGTHVIARGADRMGRILARTLAAIVKPVDVSTANNDDGACILANPLMFGTTGTVGTGGTGTVATSWQAQPLGSGSTFTIGQVACTDFPNQNWQEFNVTATGTGGAQLIQYPTTTVASKVTPLIGDGNYYEASVEYETDGWTSPTLISNVTGLSLGLDCLNSGFTTRYARGVDGWSEGSSYTIDSSESGVLRTPPIQFPAGTQVVQFAVSMTGLGKVRLRHADIRRAI